MDAFALIFVPSKLTRPTFSKPLSGAIRSSFEWASFRSTKAAVKLHTLLDLRANIPSFIHISDGKMHDVNVLDVMPIEAGAFYVMDHEDPDLVRRLNLRADCDHQKELKLEASLYTILQILSIAVSDKAPIPRALQPEAVVGDMQSSEKQLVLFDC